MESAGYSGALVYESGELKFLSQLCSLQYATLVSEYLCCDIKSGNLKFMCLSISEGWHEY